MDRSLFSPCKTAAAAHLLLLTLTACGAPSESLELSSSDSALRPSPIRPLGNRPGLTDLLSAEIPVYSRSQASELHCSLACSGSNCTEELQMAGEIFDRVNQERVRSRLPQLGRNACVTMVARGHSLAQAQARISSHSLEGRDVARRLLNADIAASTWGESIHYRWSTQNGQATFDDPSYPDNAMDFLVGSPSDLANIQNSTFTILGVGVVKSAEGDRGVYYTTLVFMSP